MALRKASAYSKKKARPYTRSSKRKGKAYIKTMPPQKIVKFKMGAISDYDKGKLKQVVKLVSGEKVQIRDNALEACRQYINNILTKELPGSFYFEVKVFPHHILRENKVLTGAGADRMSTGMQLSFGTTIGRAAIVKKNQDIFLIATGNEKGKQTSSHILRKIKAKLPCHSRLVYEKKE
jgi:large subunit ribosomal protein L10e